MRGNIDRIWAMRILRDHLEDTFLEGPQFHPLLPDFHTICMHDAPSGFTWGNTATSFIVELDPSGDAPPLMWLAYQPPCTSIYIGFSWTDALPELLTRPGKAGLGVRAPKDAPPDRFDKSSLWWRLYRILQAVKESPDTRYQDTVKHFREIEMENIDLVSRLPSRAAQLDWGEVLETQLERIVGSIESLERKWHIV
jgi:secernin